MSPLEEVPVPPALLGSLQVGGSSWLMPPSPDAFLGRDQPFGFRSPQLGCGLGSELGQSIRGSLLAASFFPLVSFLAPTHVHRLRA